MRDNALRKITAGGAAGVRVPDTTGLARFLHGERLARGTQGLPGTALADETPAGRARSPAADLPEQAPKAMISPRMQAAPPAGTPAACAGDMPAMAFRFAAPAAHQQ